MPAWPRSQRPYDKRFELLRRAYVEARYSLHYEIIPEDLQWLSECVTRLLDIVEKSCGDYLAKLETASKRESP